MEQIGFGVDHAEIKVFLNFEDKNGLPQGFANEEKTREFKYSLWTTYYVIDPNTVSMNHKTFHYAYFQKR